MKIHLLWPLLATLAQTPAYAADGDGNFAIKGAGQQTCDRFLQAYDTQSRDIALYGGWLEGYLTAFNQFTDDTFDFASWQTTESMLAILLSACRQLPPETRFMDAFYRVTDRIAPQRLTAQSTAQVLSRGNISTIIYADVLIMAKARLTELGFAPGPANADYPEETAMAMEAFQAARGLPQTGLPDQQTLGALFLNSQ
jgi:hypothetical protein